MNGFAALDILPCRRYVVVKATAGFAVCRLILKLLLFYSCLDFTQNLGKTRSPDKLERNTTSLILKSTKTASSCRTIFMTSTLKEELKKWLNQLAADERKDPARYHDSGMLFRLPNGLAVEPVLIRKKFLKWQDAPRSSRVSCSMVCGIPVRPTHAEDSYENTNRALTVQSPVFRGYIMKKSVKSYDSTLFVGAAKQSKSEPFPSDATSVASPKVTVCVPSL